MTQADFWHGETTFVSHMPEEIGALSGGSMRRLHALGGLVPYPQLITPSELDAAELPAHHQSHVQDAVFEAHNEFENIAVDGNPKRRHIAYGMFGNPNRTGIKAKTLHLDTNSQNHGNNRWLVDQDLCVVGLDTTRVAVGPVTVRPHKNGALLAIRHKAKIVSLKQGVVYHFGPLTAHCEPPDAQVRSNRFLFKSVRRNSATI